MCLNFVVNDANFSGINFFNTINKLVYPQHFEVHIINYSTKQNQRSNIASHVPYTLPMLLQ